MGHRANLVIVENQETSLYYSLWDAVSLPRHLFWGPEQGIQFVRNCEPWCEDGWLDELSCEGGCLIDIDKQVLMLYGGWHIQHEIPLRRIYLELLQQSWSDWKIQWAHRGLQEIRQYLGLASQEDPMQADELLALSLNAPEDFHWIKIVVTVNGQDGMRHYPQDNDLSLFLRRGPILTQEARQCDSFRELDLSQSVAHAIQGGLFIEETQQKLYYWSSEPIPNHEQVQEFWKGWELIWLKDHYETHLEMAGKSLHFPKFEEQTLLDHLSLELLSEPSNLQDLVQDIANAYALSEQDQQLHQEALAIALNFHPEPLTEEERFTFFNQRVTQWQQRT